MIKTFLAELRYVMKSKWRILGFVLLILVPFVYGFLYTNAYWAPFKHVDELKIAIVSRDTTDNTGSNPTYNDPTQTSKDFISQVEGEKLTTGSNQIYNVVSDQKIANDPEKYVDNGKYAAVIIIPKGYELAMKTFIKDVIANPIDITKIWEKTLGINDPKHPEIIDPNRPMNGKYDKVTFYFSYKHSYLSGEMVNFISQNTELVLKSLFPTVSGLSSSSNPILNTIANTLKPVISNGVAGVKDSLITITKPGHKNMNSYGTGLSPYFISIALFAGSLATLFVVKNERHIKTQGTLKHFFGKAMVWWMIGWLQATILIVALTIQGIRVGDGSLSDQWKLYTFALFMSTVFPLFVMSTAYTMRYGDLGEFLVVIILVLQLISSSGTFPVEMQNIVFKILHPVVPFTYSISGLREILWDTQIDKLFFDMGILLLFPLAVVPISLFLNYRFDKKTWTDLRGNKQFKSYEIHLGDF